MEKMQVSGSSLTTNDEQQAASARTPAGVMAIRGFVFVFAVSVVVDTLPNSWIAMSPLKKWFNTNLGYMGLSQGDWPLFAPNPILKNGFIVAEVVDSENQQATWNSPDWARSSAWQKFYRFRHMNYFQRVGLNRYVCSDLADYLHRAIPSRVHATPHIRWSESNEILPPAELVLPIVKIRLYQFQQRMILTEETPLPKKSETTWSNRNRFLFQREYLP